MNRLVAPVLTTGIICAGAGVVGYEVAHATYEGTEHADQVTNCAMALGKLATDPGEISRNCGEFTQNSEFVPVDSKDIQLGYETPNVSDFLAVELPVAQKADADELNEVFMLGAGAGAAAGFVAMWAVFEFRHRKGNGGLSLRRKSHDAPAM